jgi:hypothetical protein
MKICSEQAVFYSSPCHSLLQLRFDAFRAVTIPFSSVNAMPNGQHNHMRRNGNGIIHALVFRAALRHLPSAAFLMQALCFTIFGQEASKGEALCASRIHWIR